MHLKKIISGGQTGVDRGALDAALAADFPCGGWCPPGRLAEDGIIPEQYPLIEMPCGRYRQRTIKNLRDAHGTLIIYFGAPKTGTLLTANECLRRKLQHLLIDASQFSVDQAIGLAARFIEENRVETLNVAGPRASAAPEAYHYAFDLVSGILQQVGMSAPKSESSTIAWGQAIMIKMKRMAEDEEYRLAIARNLS